ncbi:MAG: hypothetical protein JKX84_00955, partial [Flavobacteriales bacterium]|nr:hypothetical protein [Flavobacteriales bacterium]
APKGLDKLIEMHLDLASAETTFDIEIRSINLGNSSLVFEDGNISVRAFPQNHRIPCYGYSFTEPPKLRNLIKEKIGKLGLSVDKIRALKAGEDVESESGECIRAKDVSSEPKPSKRYVYCTDTTPLTLPDFAENADVLYHETTYDHSPSEKALARFHSTSIQAAEVATKAKAKQLVIGHFSSRYRNSELLLSEAQSVFPNTISAEDGLTIQI